MKPLLATVLVAGLAAGLAGCARDSVTVPRRGLRAEWAPEPGGGGRPQGPAAPAPEPIPIVGDPDAPEQRFVDRLELEAVLRSVELHFPLLLAAQAEFDIARAKQRAARGAFDLRLEAGGAADLQGYYENDRWDLGLVQPLGPGGIDVLGGYRLGQGDFAGYDDKARTNEDGEFRLGLRVPLLRGRSVDPRRLAVWRARIAKESAGPAVRRVELRAGLDAAVAYWKWVGAGQKLGIARRILKLAEDRNEQLELAVQEGELAPITLTDNERSIVARRSKLYEAERDFQEAAIRLSLFLRDAEGRPRVPGEEALPEAFPDVQPLDQVILDQAQDLALRNRPEVRAVELQLEDLDLQLELAENDTLPDLDVGVFASQDVGDPTRVPDDKGPFELSLGVRLSVPLQRNSARGKVEELEARLRRGRRQRQYAIESVRADVLDAESALRQTWGQLEQAARNVVLADELARAEVLRVLSGESDLFRLNLREQQAALAGEANVEVLRDHFQALARYRAVLGGREAGEALP